MLSLESGGNQAVYDLKLVPSTVLAESDEVKKVYTESGQKGRLPANRTNILFLGDKRAGKTSLKRHLLDNGFDPQESSTVGIERELVQADEVNEYWAEVKETEHSEFQKGSALYTALHVNINENGTPQQPATDKKTKENVQRTSDRKKTEAEMSSTNWTFYVRVAISLLLPFLISPLETFSKFGLVLLSSLVVIWVIYFKQIHFRGFSIGVGTAIAATTITQFHRCVKPLPDSSLGVVYVSLLAAVGSTALGACLSLGLGGGMALAMCFMQISCAVELNIQEFKQPTIYEAYFESLGFIIGILLSSRLKLPSVKKVALVIALSGILFGLLPLSFTTMGISGLAAGTALVMGLDQGRSLARKIDLEHKLENVLIKPLIDLAGILMGLLWGNIFGLSFVLDFVNVMFSVIFLGLMIYFEVEFRMRKTKYPYKLVGKSISRFTSKENLPKKMLLLDFAGDHLYYATHPLFISSHAIFLVVFSLVKFAQNETYHMRRLIFWLHSIAAHAKNPECKVFLVGTHKDLLPRKRRKQITKGITKKIGYYPSLLEMIVFNMVNESDNTSRHSFVFCVENSVHIANDIEGLRLREALEKEVHRAEHVKYEIPLRWLKFYDLTKDRKRRKGRKDYPKNCTSSKDTVWNIVRKESVFDEGEEGAFDQMLDFYHRVGEIKLMEDFVVFDPQLVVDLLTNLLRMPVQDGASVPLKLMEKLCKSLNAPFKEVITILRHYDIVCPLLNSPLQEDTTYTDYYIVPLLLKRLDRKRNVVEVEEDILSSDPESDYDGRLPFWQNRPTDVTFFFNFKEFNPDAIFVRLLARCSYVSQQSHDLSNRRNVYSDAGRFYQSNDFYYKIELCTSADDQNLVQVTIGRAPESGVRDLLCRLDSDIKGICGRDFPYVSYTFGIQCETCPDVTDQPEQREHRWHVLKISTHDRDFPSSDVVRRLCQRQVHEVDFRRWPNTIRVVKGSTEVSSVDIERGRRITMTEHHRKLLTKNRLSLLRDLITDDVINYLIQDDVMDGDDAEMVRHQPTRRRRAEVVLDHLPRRSDAAFYSFKHALLDTRQEHLARLLED